MRQVVETEYITLGLCCHYLFLRILLHTSLDPSLGCTSLSFKFLLSHLELLKRSVARGNMTTSLEAGTLKELVEPFLEVRKLREVNTSPFCWLLVNNGDD
jgi:hypothetical protein